MLSESMLRLNTPLAIKPDTDVQVSITVDEVVQKMKEGRARWESLTPEEKVADWEKWFSSIKGGPGLPDEAVGRDGIYD